MPTVLDRAREALDASDYRQARILAGEARSRADAGRSGMARAEARRILALALLYDDEVDAARAMATEAVRIARAAGDKRVGALSELALAEVHRTRGDYLAGLRHASRARRLAARTDDPRTEGAVLSGYALLLSRLGDDTRAREAEARVLAMPLSTLPPALALRVLYNSAMSDRAAGRYGSALATLARVDEVDSPRSSSLGWLVTAARLLTLIELGAWEDVKREFARVDVGALDAVWQRAQVLAFKTALAFAPRTRGSRARRLDAEKLAAEGLALPNLEPPMRFAFERMRALALVQRGRGAEAEARAMELAADAARRGTRSHAAQALAIAARTGPTEAWQLRWLAALAAATGGADARIEHEAYAALRNEPGAVGVLAQGSLARIRARLVDHAPPAYRNALVRTLRQVEDELVAVRRAKTDASPLTLDDATLRAKASLGIVGDAPVLLRAIATVSRIARSNASLLLSGETGSGKELFARLAHALSPRAAGPFVAVNCGAIAESLLEAELFGHERGAFTGAERARPGLFAAAEGGTLFLDEVGEMSPAMQVKLLRVLEDGQVRPVGGARTRRIDVRVVAATHRDLASMVATRAFREDFYYRLAGMVVRVPALRERREDTMAVARALLHRDPATCGMVIDASAIAVFDEHDWPGNVRELDNALRAAAAMAPGAVLTASSVEAVLGGRRARTRPDAAPEETTLTALRERHKAELAALVSRALEDAKGNKLRAARALGVSRQGLYRVLES